MFLLLEAVLLEEWIIWAISSFSIDYGEAFGLSSSQAMCEHHFGVCDSIQCNVWALLEVSHYDQYIMGDIWWPLMTEPCMGVVWMTLIVYQCMDISLIFYSDEDPMNEYRTT